MGLCKCVGVLGCFVVSCLWLYLSGGVVPFLTIALAYCRSVGYGEIATIIYWALYSPSRVLIEDWREMSDAFVAFLSLSAH